MKDDTQLFITKNLAEWQKRISQNWNIIENCNVNTYPNAFVLPLKELYISKDNPNKLFQGGVISEQKEFIAGHIRRLDGNVETLGLQCIKGYTINEGRADYYEETVVFGGCFVTQIFGHLFTDNLSRMWYLDKNLSYVFACPEDIEPSTAFFTFMELLGIKKDRIIIPKKPVQFKNIIIPDQALMMFSGYNQKLNLVYDTIRNNILKKNLPHHNKNVYLSRCKLSKKDCFNEEYFENFYKKQGFEIVYPELLSLEEQISIAANAEHIVCTAGTLSHFSLFQNKNANLTILIRCNEVGAHTAQFIFNQLKNIRCSFVDVSNNILPTTHAAGIFLLGPTEDFINYAEQKDCKLSEEEKRFDYSKLLTSYLKAYQKNYDHVCYAYKRLKKLDAFDFINSLTYAFERRSLSRKNMLSVKDSDSTQFSEDVAKLKEQNALLQEALQRETEKNKKLQKDIACLKNSLSFKLGRIITLFPRRIKRYIKVIKELNNKNPTQA